MKKKLLLADDSVTIQKVVQITFSHDDYELTVVDNGEIAYEKARQQRPDLILADVFMPGKNGYELCAAVKNDPSLASVPVLLLTGTFEPFDEAKAKSVGADRWIAKPFESQALIACVEDLLTLAAQSPVAIPQLQVPTPPLQVPPPMVSTPLSDEPADFPDDIWGSDFAVETAVTSSEQFAGETVAAPSQDDLWDVSGFESDAPVEPATAATDDLWGSFEPPASAAEEVIVSDAVSVEDESDPWGNDDFATSFATELEPPSAGALLADEDEILPVSDIEVLDETDLMEPVADVPVETAAATDVFAACDFSFEEVASLPEPVVEPVALVPPAPIVVPIPLPMVEVLQQEAVAPLSPQILPQGAALSNDQLELIVERVAEVVISRLAGTLLEKIAWEVVPDLAETMIKEELRKIRESVAAD